MKKHTKIYIAIIVIVAIAIVFAIKPQQKGTVTIGGLFNLTGYASFAGESSRDGFLMAIEDAKLPVGLVKTVVEDGGSDLKQVVSGAKKLTEIDGAMVVLGPEWTEFGEVASPVAVANKVPFISPWIVAEASFVKPPYFWSASPSFRSEHAALAKYYSDHGLKNISLLYSTNSWSYADIAMFKEEATRYSGLSFVSEQPLDQSTKDFRTAIAKLKQDHADVIYVAIADDEAYGAFLKQARQSGITVPISTFSARATSDVLKDRYLSVLPGELFAESVPAERSAEFAAKYEKRFGKKVGAPSAAATYDMASIVFEAIRKGASTSDAIASYLSSMPPYDGYSGKIDYDKNGRLPLRNAVVKVFNSKGDAEIAK